MLNHRLQFLAGLAAAVSCTGAYLTDPPTAAASDTASDCSSWQVVTDTDTCDAIAASWLITATAFREYLQACCGQLILCRAKLGPYSGNAYKLDTIYATPSPIQPGMVSNCNKFYLVVKDDTCYDIASRSSISLDQLYSWNPAVGNECRTLWPANYICVGVTGGSQSPSPTQKPSSTPSPTTSPNGINTSSPIQSGMTGNCDEFYLVKDNDICYDIAKNYGITLDQFYAWNPAIGNTCAAPWPKNYVCVSIIGVSQTTLITQTTPTSTKPWEMPLPCTFDVNRGEYVCPTRTPTPTPTKPGNGITTPTPFQVGMTNNCKKFHKVVWGDGCWAIANTYKIDLNDFYKWNPGVGSACATLWPDNYVCVGT